jgi:hypothetical protein
MPYEHLKELLTMDYLLATKKTYLPEFLQIQAAGIYNDRIAEIKNRMKDMDFRFTVFMPVSIRVIKRGKDIILEKWDGLCSIGVKNGNIEYYKI